METILFSYAVQWEIIVSGLIKIVPHLIPVSIILWLPDTFIVDKIERQFEVVPGLEFVLPFLIVGNFLVDHNNKSVISLCFLHKHICKMRILGKCYA